MNSKEIKEVWDRYKEGESTPDDMALLESWYIDYEQKESSPLSEKEITNRLESIGKKLASDRQKQSSIHIWKRISIAATIVFCLGVGFYYYKNSNKESFAGSVAKRDIPPGKNKAYLTLANGSKISLADAANGNLAKQAGINITKTANGKLVYEITGSTQTTLTENIEYNTIETPRGGQYQVILPDGSKVWLNAASSIKFPLTFNNLPKRKIELTGEAYFEVAKNKDKPFTVTTSKQEITVLGTHFNVNSYTDESVTKTTLLEGSVKVVSTITTSQKNANSDIVSTVLKPGQQSLLSFNKLTIQPADIDETIAWKEGYFRFNDEKLESIMRKVSRWYDVEIEYENEKLKNEPFAGVTTRFANVSKLFRMLELTNEVRFRIDGKKIKVLDKK